MVNKTEKVYEVDCDLDTLICWLQDNPDWPRKISQISAKSPELSKTVGSIHGILFPPQLFMSSPISFSVKGRLSLLKPIVFSIVERRNVLEIKTGELRSNNAQVGFVSKSSRLKSALRIGQFRLKNYQETRIQKISAKHLNAFFDLIKNAGLPPAKGHGQ